jgi:signal transduction histidine kinase
MSRNAGRSRPGRRRHRRGRSGRLELTPERDSSSQDREILDELDRPPFPPFQPVSPAPPVPPAPAAEPVPPVPPRPDPSRGLDAGDGGAAAQGDPESDDYDRARSVAERKAELYIDGGKKAIVVIVLLIVPPLSWLGFILAVVWGIKFARRYFSLTIEPGLRERPIEEEGQKEVHVNVSRERRSLEGEHSQSLEQLSASIAHEIRNPITAAKSLVQQIGEEPGAPDNSEYARVAVEELARVERSITHLLRFARDEEMRFGEVRMVDVLESALETFRDRVARDGVEIVRNFDCEGVLDGDADKLRRIVINLVGNGIDALVEAGIEDPRMDISLGENLAGSEVWVRIRDNGRGIDDELREKIFRPFVTSKSGGTGLGLPITKKLVESHGGTIELMSEPGEGAEFVLTIPKRGMENRGRP